MMGWSAVRGELDLAAWVLFGILFFWQMPHFLAIAWLCREDYARGGFPMLPVLDPDGTRTGRQAILYGAALVPVRLLPSLLGLMGTVYFVGALALGLVYLGFSFGFARGALDARRAPADAGLAPLFPGPSAGDAARPRAGVAPSKKSTSPPLLSPHLAHPSPGEGRKAKLRCSSSLGFCLSPLSRRGPGWEMGEGPGVRCSFAS